MLQWQHLKGSQAEFAQSSFQAQATDIQTYGDSDSQFCVKIVFHPSCYARFTDKQHIVWVQNCTANGKEVLYLSFVSAGQVCFGFFFFCLMHLNNFNYG